MQVGRGGAGLALIIALFCAGCTLMPASGPRSTDVRAVASENPESLPYALVRVTPEVVRTLRKYAPRLSTAFANRTPPRGFRLGIGDVVSVTIFESAAGGLFIPAEAGSRAGNFVVIPDQAVDNDGNITVPYAGPIHARGRTLTEVQNSIVEALKDRAIEPQAVVALVQQQTSLVSVLGDVQRAGRFPANASGERILDAITRAGGPASQGYDTWVTLERRGNRASVPFGALVYEPSNNIYVLPNDVIYLFRQPQTFLAFGAGDHQGQFNFDAWRISVAEAIGKQGGLADGAADPASVFLYRGEPREVAERLGVDCSRFKGPIVPIIYNFNLRDPSGYFMAQSFEMRNKDVMYTSNADSVEISKFLNFLRTIMATVNDPIIYATNWYGLKAVANGTGTTTVITTPPPINP